FQTISALPSDFKKPNDAAEIAVHSSGKFVYTSNRGHDSIAAFAVDPRKGTLALTEIVPIGYKTPRNFAINPTGKFLLVGKQESDSIVVYRIDDKTGRLKQMPPVVGVPSPVCITFFAAE